MSSSGYGCLLVLIMQQHDTTSATWNLQDNFWHDMTCNMLWMRYPGCSIKTNPSSLWMRYPGSSTPFINISWNKHLRMHIMIHDIWMKSSAYLTTLSSLNKDASGEGNSREIFQTLNPKLKVCPVTRTAGQTAAVSLHTQQGGTVARRPTSEGARAIQPARAHRTGALQADERSPRMSNPKP